MTEIPTSKIEFLKESLKYIARLPLYNLSCKTGFPLSKPISASILLTSRCNLNCPFCFIEKNEFKNRLNENELKNLINNLAKWGIKQLSFTGGEPLKEKKLLFKLLKYAKKRGMIVGFVTNGTLFSNNDIKILKEICVDRISVSIDGPEVINDSLRGRYNYKKAIIFLKKMSDIQKKYGKPQIRINSIIIDQNIKYLEWLFFMSKNLNAQLVLSPLGMDYLTAVKKRRIQLRTIKKLWVKACNFDLLKININKLKQLKKRYGTLLNTDSFLDSIVKYYKTPLTIKRHCKIGTYHIGFSRSGDVVLCGYLGILGNIKYNSPKYIWKSKKFMIARKKMKICNKCLIPCQYTPPINELINDFFIRPLIRKTTFSLINY